MDHAEALELIELAAVEPDGLERLMAGDTPGSAAVAGHLAGCPSCVAQLARIRRTSALARAAIAGAPDPALRERTLAYVREVGVSRSSGAGLVAVAGGAGVVPAGGSGVGSAAPGADSPGAGAPGAASAAGAAPATASRRRWAVVAGLAAALVLGIGLGVGVAVVRSPAPQLADEVQVLQATTAATLRIEAQPDARRVPLTATDAAAGAVGTLVYSPSTGELVMVAAGLAPLAEGETYGCWIEVDGDRSGIGKMYPGGDLQAWAGPVEGLAELPEGTTFGVSRVPADGSGGQEVLTGS